MTNLECTKGDGEIVFNELLHSFDIGKFVIDS